MVRYRRLFYPSRDTALDGQNAPSDYSILLQLRESMSKKSYPSLDSLLPVATMINEAKKALDDETFTIDNSTMPEVLASALGAGVGYAGSFFALKALGVAGLSGAGITSGLAAAGGGLSAAAAVGGIAVSPMCSGKSC